MAIRNNEQAVIDLVINGEQAKTSYKEVTGAVNALRAEMAKLKEANDPAAIAKAREEWKKMVAVQQEMKEAIYATKEEASELERILEKGFEVLEIGLLIEKFAELGKELFELEEKADGIHNAFAGIGASEEYIDGLRKATKGLVEDLDLEKLSVQAQKANIPLEDMALFLKFATQQARDTGQSVDDLAERMITGLGKGTTKAVQGLGLNMVQVKDEFKKTGDMVEAVANIIKIQMKNAGDDVDNFGDVVGRQKTKWEDLKDSIAGIFKKIFTPELASSDGIATRTKKELSEFGDFGKFDQGQLDDAISTQSSRMNARLELYKKAQQKYADAQKDAQKTAGDQAVYISTKKEAEAVRSTAEAYQGALNALKLLNQEKQKRSDSKSDGSVAAIDQEITKLKDVQSELSTTSADWKKYQLQIDALEKQKRAITGEKEKSDPAIKKLEGEKEATAKAYRDLQEQYKGFTAQEIAEAMAKNDKEVALAKEKFDKEIALQRKFLTDQKGITPDQRKGVNDNISALQAEKQKAVNDLIAKQEKELDDKIIALKEQLSQRLATERQKDIDLINKDYDQQKKDAGTNQDEVAKIEQARKLALQGAQLEEEKRFAEEKKKIDTEASESGDKTGGDPLAAKITAIQSEAAKEIEELKKKYSTELQMTQAFQDAVKEINQTAQNEIAQAKQEDAKKWQDMSIQGAETLANAISEIASRNAANEANLQLKNLSRQEEAEIAGKNLTEGQKEAIQKKFDAEAAAIKKKQWEAERQAKAEQALINGAVAAIKLWVDPGFPAAIPLVAEVAAQTIAQEAIILSQPAPQFGTGGVFDGPSHAQGGLKVVDSKTGAVRGEVEGGEPWMVLSKETQRNNGALIAQLLHNSMYRNGAKVDTGGVSQGIQYAQYGAIFSNGAFGRPTSTHTSTPAPASHGQVDIAETNRLLAGLHDKFDDFSQKPFDFNNRAFENYTTLIAASRAAMNAG